jgi:hypothetical protein
VGPPRSPCCAHAVNGQAAAAAPSSVMTSPRLNRSNCIRSLTIQPDGSVGVYRSVEDESGRIAIRMGAVLWRKAKPRSTAPRRWNAKPSHKPRAIHSFNGSVISGRAARGSASLRKATCQVLASDYSHLVQGRRRAQFLVGRPRYRPRDQGLPASGG